MAHPTPREMAEQAADHLVATVPSAMRPTWDELVRDMEPMIRKLDQQLARQAAYRASLAADSAPGHTAFNHKLAFGGR